MPVQVYFYNAGHAFFNDENLLGTYNEEAAKLAWGRTLEFLRSALARGSEPVSSSRNRGSP